MLWWLATAGGADAHEAQPAEPEQPAQVSPPAEPTPPQPYPIAELAVHAEETRREVEAIAKHLAPASLIDAIAAQTPPREQLVENAAGSAARTLASSPTLNLLADLEREWLTRQRDLSSWREQVTERAAAIGKASTRLRELQERWTASREVVTARPPAEPEAGAPAPEPDPALEWIDDALEGIATVQAMAQQREARLLDVQRRLARIQSTIDQTLAEVRQFREQRRSRVLEPDVPPLWEARPVGDAQTALAGIWERWGRDASSLRAYFELRGERFVGHLILLLATLLAALALRKRVDAWSESDPDLGPTAGAFRRPVSVTLLIGLLAGVFLYPLAPTALGNLMGLLLLIPAVRLLPPLVPSAYQPIIYALALFYLSFQLRQLLGGAPFAERILLALELLAGIVFLLWLARPARLSKIENPERLPYALRPVRQLVLALLALSLLANLVGYVSFARILSEGTLMTIYAGVIVYGAYRIARSFVRVALLTGPARRLRMVRTGSASIERWSGRVFQLAGLLIWLDVTFTNFAIRDEVLEVGETALTTDLSVGNVSISLGDVVAFALTLGAAYLLSRLVRFVLEEDVLPRLALRRGIPNAVSTVVNYLVFFLGFLFALAAAGFELSRITLLAGAFGVGIGFGLQNVVNNFVSGLILLFERPIQVGDTIEVQGLLGEVRRIGARSSTVRTFDGAEVIVPNGMLISDQVVNWTLSDRRRRVVVGVGVAYGTDPERVLELLREVAAENETVLDEPAPLVVFTGFGDSSLNFEMRCWIPRYEEGFSMRSALWVAINARLRDAGIEIPFPQRDLHLRSVDAPAREAFEGMAARGDSDAERSAGKWRTTTASSSPSGSTEPAADAASDGTRSRNVRKPG